MKILLRKSEGKIRALDPESGESLTRIPAYEKRPVWCQDHLSAAYEHSEGLYWESWERARQELQDHHIVTDEGCYNG